MNIGYPISFKPQYDMWVFPTFINALRFVAFEKAFKYSHWESWHSMHNEEVDENNRNMLVLELKKGRELVRYIVTKAPISQDVFRL